MSILDRLFPAQADNRYRGQVAAIWLFVPLVALRLAIALGGMFTPDGGTQGADGIPLDTYSPAAARAVIGVGAFLGLANLWLCLWCVLALLRYRALLPLMFAMLSADYLAHKGVGLIKPIARVAGPSPGGYIQLGLFVISLIGLALSLSGKAYAGETASDLSRSRPVRRRSS